MITFTLICVYLDVVYIGTVHPVHKPICEMFINAGINILCEKPFTVNATEAKAIIDLARQKNVFVMEVSLRSNV